MLRLANSAGSIRFANSIVEWERVELGSFRTLSIAAGSSSSVSRPAFVVVVAVSASRAGLNEYCGNALAASV
jgi:hypothetical protein